MPHKRPQLSHTRSIQTALGQYQEQVIIPHCRECQRPCCKLTDVVLEFDWRHLQAFYAIEQGQKAFDRSLRDGTAPHYIRKQGELYFTHGDPCPGYDQVARTCRYYRSDLKPENCADFPLYLDDTTIVADTRCEALDADKLLASLRSEFPLLRFRAQADPDYPVLVYIDYK